VRIALIGLGDIAQKAYLPIMSSLPDVYPVLCTRNQSTLAFLSGKYRIPESYSELSELLKHKPDAVMIHSATESHFEVAKQCIQAGIATFIDKPISYTLRESEHIINLSEQKNVPLFIGFNRRFAPLYQELLQSRPLHIRYQKNRLSLPDETRVFVFDDFIHVLDFFLFSAKRHGMSANLQSLDVYSYVKEEKLGIVQVQWQCEETLFTASMNRLNGINEERLEYFSIDEKWQIDNLRTGVHASKGSQAAIGFDDWQDTLYKRGFVDMIQSFVAAVKSGGSNIEENALAFESHKLCDAVIRAIVSSQR